MKKDPIKNKKVRLTKIIFAYRKDKNPYVNRNFPFEEDKVPTKAWFRIGKIPVG